MSRDSRLSGVLHVLLHLNERKGPVTSATLARMMGTHPVAVRRIMAGLRERGYVRSERGHGGGWTLDCDPEQVTLLDIYQSIGAPSLFAIANRNDSPDCAVEQAVNTALQASLDQARELLLESFRGVTLASLAQDFHHRLAQRMADASRGIRHER